MVSTGKNTLLESDKKIIEIDNEIVKLKEQLDNAKGTPCEVYTRIVGYHRAVDSWNKGKREEFKNRVTYTQNSFKEKKVFKCDEDCLKCIEHSCRFEVVKIKEEVGINGK